MSAGTAFSAARSNAGIAGVDAQQYSAYAGTVDNSEDYPTIDTIGWAPSLRLGPTDIPDSFRNATGQPRQYPAFPDSEKDYRHSVEDQNAVGWTEQKSIRAGENAYTRQAPPPRATPPPEDRPTMKMGQNTYSFTRPFDQTIARRFTGEHFSMADNHRNYGLSSPYDMAPNRKPGGGTRNTFRLMPQPWDTDVVDTMPNSNVPQPQLQAYPTYDVPPIQSRTMRLM